MANDNLNKSTTFKEEYERWKESPSFKNRVPSSLIDKLDPSIREGVSKAPVDNLFTEIIHDFSKINSNAEAATLPEGGTKVNIPVDDPTSGVSSTTSGLTDVPPSDVESISGYKPMQFGAGPAPKLKWVEKIDDAITTYNNLKEVDPVEKAAVDSGMKDATAIFQSAMKDVKNQKLIDRMVSAFGQFVGGLYGNAKGVAIGTIDVPPQDFKDDIEAAKIKLASDLDAIKSRREAAEKQLERQRQGALLTVQNLQDMQKQELEAGLAAQRNQLQAQGMTDESARGAARLALEEKEMAAREKQRQQEAKDKKEERISLATKKYSEDIIKKTADLINKIPEKGEDDGKESAAKTLLSSLSKLKGISPEEFEKKYDATLAKVKDEQGDLFGTNVSTKKLALQQLSAELDAMPLTTEIPATESATTNTSVTEPTIGRTGKIPKGMEDRSEIVLGDGSVWKNNGNGTMTRTK